MDKQKSRHISRKKFERVSGMAWDEAIAFKLDSRPCQIVKLYDDSLYHGISYGDFFYWRQDELDGNWKYYRKSLREVFK